MRSGSNLTSIPTNRSYNPDVMDAVYTILNELRGSVASLQTANEGLQKELQLVKRELKVLQQGSGARFPKFGQLPPEVRRTIWQYACRTPQIHIINENAASTSKINSIVNSCTEARAAAESLRLDHFVPSPQNVQDWKSHGQLRIYVNFDIDTIWVNGPNASFYLPTFVSSICGTCGNETEAYRLGYCYFCDQSDSGYASTPVRRYAINCAAWRHPDDIDRMGSMMFLAAMPIEELFLIVGEYKSLEAERDLQFISPLHGPLETFCAMTDFEYWEDVELEHKWEDLESDLVKCMEEFKSARAYQRQLLVDSGEATFEELDTDDSWDHVIDLSDLKIPRIKFVEVRKHSQDWVSLPSETL